MNGYLFRKGDSEVLQSAVSASVSSTDLPGYWRRSDPSVAGAGNEIGDQCRHLAAVHLVSLLVLFLIFFFFPSLFFANFFWTVFPHGD
jgi:hypothetical protein